MTKECVWCGNSSLSAGEYWCNRKYTGSRPAVEIFYNDTFPVCRHCSNNIVWDINQWYIKGRFGTDYDLKEVVSMMAAGGLELPK